MLLVIFANGCKHEYKFSKIQTDGFGFESNLRNQGFELTKFPEEAVSNEVYGYAWRSWHGIATSTNLVTCQVVATTVRDSLNRALNGVALDELTTKAGRAGFSNNNALSGMLRYNKDQMHGDLFVWLTADESGRKINYVIYLREETLKN